MRSPDARIRASSPACSGLCRSKCEDRKQPSFRGGCSQGRDMAIPGRNKRTNPRKQASWLRCRAKTARTARNANGLSVACRRPWVLCSFNPTQSQRLHRAAPDTQAFIALCRNGGAAHLAWLAQTTENLCARMGAILSRAAKPVKTDRRRQPEGWRRRVCVRQAGAPTERSSSGWPVAWARFSSYI